MAVQGEGDKVNLHQLLRQVQSQMEQKDFFYKHGLLPRADLVTMFVCLFVCAILFSIMK